MLKKRGHFLWGDFRGMSTWAGPKKKSELQNRLVGFPCRIDVPSIVHTREMQTELDFSLSVSSRTICNR
jgi:hypothetical protein